MDEYTITMTKVLLGEEQPVELTVPHFYIFYSRTCISSGKLISDHTF